MNKRRRFFSSFLQSGLAFVALVPLATVGEVPTTSSAISPIASGNAAATQVFRTAGFTGMANSVFCLVPQTIHAWEGEPDYYL